MGYITALCAAGSVVYAVLGGGCASSTATIKGDDIMLKVHADMRSLKCQTVVTNVSRRPASVSCFEKSGLGLNGAVTIMMKVRDGSGRTVSRVGGGPGWWMGNMIARGANSAGMTPRQLRPGEEIVNTYDLATVFVSNQERVFTGAPIPEGQSLGQWLHGKSVKLWVLVSYGDVPASESGAMKSESVDVETEWMVVP